MKISAFLNTLGKEIIQIVRNVIQYGSTIEMCEYVKILTLEKAVIKFNFSLKLTLHKPTSRCRISAEVRFQVLLVLYNGGTYTFLRI